MHPEVEELRPKLKEVLYDCAVDIRATKAALYLFDGAGLFELVTEYGFKSGVRVSADSNDPLVDRCGRGRNAFFVNGVAAEPRFSELLYEASTDRLLAAPLYIRGKLIGLIDMRDKPGRQPFESSDLPKAQRIAERLVELLIDKPIFGHRFITLSKLSGQHSAAGAEDPEAATAVSGDPPVRDHPFAPPAAAAPPVQKVPVPVPPPAPVAAPPLPRRNEVRAHLPGLATLVIDARTIASRIMVASSPDLVGENELTAAREVLRSILLIPGAVAATFSVFGPSGGVQDIAARSSVTDEARSLLQSKLNVWLSKRGESGGAARTSVLTPFGTSGPPVGAADLQKVFTAPVTVGALRGLYLTVAFGGTPDRGAHELLAVLHAHLQLVIEQSLQRGAAAALQWRIAEKLVEPDFTTYPELRLHSDAVSKLCESFGRHLAITPAEAEAARIVGHVHDVGMRLLDYARLYRKRDLTQEELGFLREHPSVGAAMVEPLLGVEIARAVLCHHERFDGRGYPNELSGEEIPLLSRIVQICDAWVAMTDPGTYQPAESHENAMATIVRGGGSQFDPGLATRFADMMRSAAR
ncbi:MAG: HD domain-containing protein [Acidobacteriota bacterium]|nr:HD domain-containing protein [Acidobacteriota bacterium]